MKKAIASFQYGYLLKESDGAKFCVGFLLAICSVIWIYNVIFIGCILGGVFEADKVFIFAVVVMDIISIAFLALAVCVLVNDKKIRKMIESWQEDFVETTATVIDNSKHTLVGLIPTVRVELYIEFNVKGKKYKKTSALASALGKNMPFGLYRAMRKLSGYEVPIYYSKKYDQVVFIKWQ